MVLLPHDPDASARAMRTGLRATTGHNVAVVVTDTAGRAWRQGQTDLAIGAAGFVVLDDHAGRVDGYGNLLAVTAPALADEVAGAADLAQGKLAGRPVAVVRGLAAQCSAPATTGPAPAPEPAVAEDMFGLGAREVVPRSPGSRPRLGTPAHGATSRRPRAGGRHRDGRRRPGPVAGEAGPEARAVAHAHGWVTDRDIPAVLQPHLP